LALPESALDSLINHFGASNVAELTGRKGRMEQQESGVFKYTSRAADLGVAGKNVLVAEKTVRSNSWIVCFCGLDWTLTHCSESFLLSCSWFQGLHQRQEENCGQFGLLFLSHF
jgi:hypothetical protein